MPEDTVSLNVVITFDLIDEEAYKPPLPEDGGGKRYQEAKGRFEKRK